jgi:hypothetical protein
MDTNGQDGRHGRISSLFTNELRFPKLDVAGSIPASRSMFSITYWDSDFSSSLLNELIALCPIGNH